MVMMATDAYHVFFEDGSHGGTYGSLLGVRKAIAKMEGVSLIQAIYLEMAEDDPHTLEPVLVQGNERIPLAFIVQPADHPDVVVTTVTRRGKGR